MDTNPRVNLRSRFTCPQARGAYCSLAPLLQCSACGLTKPPGHCIHESECSYNDQVEMPVTDFVEIDQTVLPPALYRHTYTDMHFVKKHFDL